MKFIYQKETFFFWCFVFVLNLLLRISSFYTPILDVDETQFAGFAHVLMDGGLPYLNSLDTKPLGIYLFYWLVFAVFGKTNMCAVHFVTALVTFVSSYFLARIFYRFNKDRMGRLAALLFIVFSTTFVPKFIATSINSVMVFFLVISVFFIARSVTKGTDHDDWLAGLFLGIGFLFKYTAGIQWVLYGFFTLIVLFAWPEKLIHQEKAKRPNLFLVWLKRNLFFVIGFWFPFLLHSFLLYKMGVWDDYVLWSFKGSGAYLLQGGNTILFWQSFLLRFGGFVLASLFVWVYFIKGIGKKVFNDSLYVLLFFWFVLTLIPVCLGGRFYPHYFIPLLPALCGLAAYGIETLKVNNNPLKVFVSDRSININERLPKIPKKVVLLLIVLPVILSWGLRLHHPTYLKYFPDDGIYEQQKIGEFLREKANSDDTLFVWGFATGIYFHSGLKPVSRFLWADLLTGRTPGPYYARKNQEQETSFGNPIAWQAFWADINKNPPTYFLDTAPANIHDYARFPIKNYPKLNDFIQKNYHKVDNELGVGVYRLAIPSTLLRVKSGKR